MAETPVSLVGLPPAAPPSQWQQFKAVVYKNMLLQLRSRTVLCGVRLGGIASVAFEVLLPVLFIAVMCLVKRWPTVPGQPQVFREWLLADDGWARIAEGARPARQARAQLSTAVGRGCMTRHLAHDRTAVSRHDARFQMSSVHAKAFMWSVGELHASLDRLGHTLRPHCMACASTFL